MKNIPKAMIKAMSYENRQRNYNQEKDEVVVFAENRSLDSEIELDVSLDGFDGYKICEHIEFYADDLNTENDKESQRVLPKSRDISGKIELKKHSWNMLRYKGA